jgi:soluble lytic murein transglycosylase-like protein
MPDTAAMLGVNDALNPSQNIDGGVRYLGMMLQKFNGDYRLAAAAYNAGPSAVEQYGGVPPYQETRAYVDKVVKTIDGGVG